MQISATRHSSRISTELTASLASFGTGSGALAVVICTGGVSGGSICDESGNAASTIDSGTCEAAAVSVTVPVTDSAAVVTSALATAAVLPITLACAAYASSASAARDGARWSSIGTAPVFSMPAEPKPASQATTKLARTTVPQNDAATVANRRGFMIPSPPKAPMLHSQACDGADSSDQDINAQ